MARPRKLYRIKKDHWNGRHFYDLLLDGRKVRLIATNQEAAAAEGASRYAQIILERNSLKATQAAPGPRQPALKPVTGSLREAVSAYRASDTFALYKAGKATRSEAIRRLIEASSKQTRP